jgi:hypothetical protein
MANRAGEGGGGGTSKDCAGPAEAAQARGWFPIVFWGKFRSGFVILDCCFIYGVKGNSVTRGRPPTSLRQGSRVIARYN